MVNSGLFITWPQLLVVGVLIIFFYLAELAFFWFRHGRKNKDTDKNLSYLLQQISDLRQELEVTKIRISAMSMQLTQNHLDVSQSKNELQDEVVTTSIAVDSPYSQAIRLAQMGSDASELAASCGISRGEADLIVAIYRSDSRS